MDAEQFNVTIKRGSIPIKSLTVSYMLNDTVGLIKLQRFSERSADEFDDAPKSVEASTRSNGESSPVTGFSEKK